MDSNVRYLASWILCLFLLAAASQSIASQPFLKVNGTSIDDGRGNEMILRGMGLGGWMLQEGYMLQIYNDGAQHTIRKRIVDLIGEDDCDRFYQLWLQNHVTKADIDSLAAWGFNSVRLPMHYNLFTLPIEQEPVAGQNTWLTTGFELTDSLVAWCKLNGLYLILDLHAAPGGQGNDANICDYDPSKPSLWESELNRKKTVALWRKLAERYANEPTIGAYDVLNEPNWSFEGKDKHGREDILNQPIWDLYREITAAIREVDPNHIIIIEGNGWGNNYNGFTGPWDNNMVLSFHKYWNINSQESIAHFIALRDKFNMPVWLGESGENSNKWFTDCISLMETNQIGWAWWPLKKIGSVVCPLIVVVPNDYKKVVDYWNGKAERPSPELARNALFQVAENLKISSNVYNRDVIDAMFRQVRGGTHLSFKPNHIPGRIFATDFDFGGEGDAYHDKESERTGEPGKDVGNKGFVYRNDGVDITLCGDEASFSNGYCVNSIEDGEWLKFTVTVTRSGKYKLLARVASGNEQGVISVDFGSSASTKKVVPVPVTGGEQIWQTVSLGKVSLKKGKQVMTVKFDKGGYSLGSVALEY